MRGFNLSEWALESPLHRRVPHDRRRRRRPCVLLPAGSQRGPHLHHQDHGGSGRVAGSHDRGHAQAGHRADRAQAAGDAQARFPAQLHDCRQDDDLRQSARQRHRRGGPRHLVPRAQEHRRHLRTPCRWGSSVRASTTISATPSASSTASRPTASRIASCATMSRTSAPSSSTSPTSRRSRSSERRTSGSSSSSRCRSSPASASTARR